MSPRTDSSGKRRLATQQSVDQVIKNICDVMRRGNCAGAMQYVPELTWLLFLRILDEREYGHPPKTFGPDDPGQPGEADEAEAVGATFTYSLEAPYRWQDWAAAGGAERIRRQRDGKLGDYFSFVNTELIPYLKRLRERPGATPRQKVISEIMSSVDRVRIDTERNFCDVLDRIHEVRNAGIDATHVFTLSQVYEGLLLKMGEKGNDGGQFFTPREVIRAMVRVVDPKPGETVHDPSCGTGGFLAQAYEYVVAEASKAGKTLGADELERLKGRTFYGREKENLVYPIALANLVLHGIDRPNIWHGNTLTGTTTYGGLFEGAPEQFDVILTNPPFGGKEGKDAQVNYDYPCGATQVLFVQEVIRRLRPGGRCGIVLDEGLLYRTNEGAFVKTKRKLLDDCNVWCIVSLPGGVFGAAGAGVKTNILFFTKGQRTEKIWYFDMSDLKIKKTDPLTLDHFKQFFTLLPRRADSEMSWTVDFVARKRDALEAANPFRQESMAKRQLVEQGKERLAGLKRAAKPDYEAIADLEARNLALHKESLELAGKAENIENAAYDLKAVNPNRKDESDQRTSGQLLNFIEQKGVEIAGLLAALRGADTGNAHGLQERAPGLVGET